MTALEPNVTGFRLSGQQTHPLHNSVLRKRFEQAANGLPSQDGVLVIEVGERLRRRELTSR